MMYTSPTPLPPLGRPTQPPIYHPLPSSSHASPRDDDDEEETSYHPDPLPSATLEAGGERLLVSSPSRGAAKSQLESTHPGVPHAMSSALVLSASQAPVSPDIKTTENGTGEGDAGAEEDKKRDREHKKRSRNWTRPETLKLIWWRKELEPRFAKSGRKTELWDEIADNLQRERITRDAQQCRDKWEKLTAGYKDVGNGLKSREDNPFYDELHQLLSMKRERERDKESFGGGKDGPGKEYVKESNREPPAADGYGRADMDEDAVPRNGKRPRVSSKGEDNDDLDEVEPRAPPRKKKRNLKCHTGTDLNAVQRLMEYLIMKQHNLFREFLENMEKNAREREQIRQEKEDKWNAEARYQRGVLNKALSTLAEKLCGDRLGSAVDGPVGPVSGSPDGPQGPKRRSKNWKRAEVLQLIKMRGDMESRFVRSARKTALWDELAEQLAAQGIKRDGKQCREKWDKLMSEYKEVTDKKREPEESSYFTELALIVGHSPPVESA